MADITHPALQALIHKVAPEWVLGQVRIRRGDRGFELRHIDDRDAEPSSLREVPLTGLRELARFTEAGAFRPLKSAPNLRRGWVARVADPAALERAMEHLLPGAIADCHAAAQPGGTITHYREFTARQTGMYRNTARLDDNAAARVARSVCHLDFCLKRRLWTVPGLEAEEAEAKSCVPCLEPCALLLEFAGKAWRWEQTSEVERRFNESEAATIQAALEKALSERGEGAADREADFSDPLNPRRLRYVLSRWREDGF